jgi:hypothetical protein
MGSDIRNQTKQASGLADLLACHFAVSANDPDGAGKRLKQPFCRSPKAHPGRDSRRSFFRPQFRSRQSLAYASECRPWDATRDDQVAEPKGPTQQDLRCRTLQRSRPALAAKVSWPGYLPRPAWVANSYQAVFHILATQPRQGCPRSGDVASLVGE